MKTTKEAMAARLNGREYGSEITREECREAKESGLYVIFGYSDDNLEVRGMQEDEWGCYDGGEFWLTERGVGPVIEDDQHGNLDAVWDEDGYSWTYKTDVPHATFEVLDDGEMFCRGIVVDAADLPSVNSIFTNVSPPVSGTRPPEWDRPCYGSRTDSPSDVKGCGLSRDALPRSNPFSTIRIRTQFVPGPIIWFGFPDFPPIQQGRFDDPTGSGPRVNRVTGGRKCLTEPKGYRWIIQSDGFVFIPALLTGADFGSSILPSPVQSLSFTST